MESRLWIRAKMELLRQERSRFNRRVWAIVTRAAVMRERCRNVLLARRETLTRIAGHAAIAGYSPAIASAADERREIPADKTSLLAYAPACKAPAARAPSAAYVPAELAVHSPRKPTKAERKLQRAAEYNRQNGPSVREKQEAICAAIMSDSAAWLEVSAEPCEPDVGEELVPIVDRHGRFALVPVSAADAIAERARERLAEGKGISARGGACRQITGHAHVPDAGQRAQRIVASALAMIAAE